MATPSRCPNARSSRRPRRLFAQAARISGSAAIALSTCRAATSFRCRRSPHSFEQIDYYRTCFHELGHWTGHPARLARDLSGTFGSKTYAREELVAEIAAAFVCATLGIEPTVRHADYIGSWLKVLREDNRAIFRAASLASKAADFLLGFNAEAEGAQQDEIAA